MAARKNRVHHDPATIERIRATIAVGQLIKRLSEHVKGDVELSQTQVRAADILLKKTLPDLNSTTVTGSDGGPVKIEGLIREIVDTNR